MLETAQVLERSRQPGLMIQMANGREIRKSNSGFQYLCNYKIHGNSPQSLETHYHCLLLEWSH